MGTLSVRRSSKGQATLLIVTVICVVGTIVLMSSLDIFVRDYNQKAKDFNQVLLDETTSSAFAVMETALERRLWEPPPDSNCLRSENMEVSGSTPDDVSWKVTAKFNFTTKNFEMTATGEYKNLTSTFKKKIKVMDVSDYLLLSTNTEDVYLQRLYNLTAPTALIARDRRIYTRGALNMGSAINRNDPKMDFGGYPANWPGDWGTIVQGDRMQFGGGIFYTPYSVPMPNPHSSNIETLVAPFADGTYASQWGGGSTVFTKDVTKATQLQTMVETSATGPLTKASLANEVYPIALFNGTPPLKAWTATDNGTYFNDPDRESIFTYAYAGASSYGIRINATCFSKTTAFADKKYCSHSEHFPKAFNAWRTNAGLDGYLFTEDAVAVPAPTIGWDNLKSLEEDARTCGAVVSTPINPYVDCPVWDTEFINKYAGGDTSGCQSISKINLDTIPLNGLNIAALNDPANSGRLLRRVIYLKGPATIQQSDPAGLMLSTVSNNVARKNLSVWIVSEDLITLQGHQADTTSPLTERPTELREIVFNGDTTSSPSKEPIAFTMLSTERVHLISPDYKPMTPTHLATIWPVSGGVIRPTRHNMTDWERFETDGFKYGYRRYKINGLSLISNSKVSAGEPFYLQGLWSGPDSSDHQLVSNQCMASLAGQNFEIAGVKANERFIYGDAKIPTYINNSNSPLPPTGSNFYGSSPTMPHLYVPQVFWVQRAGANAGREQSEIELNGITMSTEFSSATEPGLRPLNVPKYKVGDVRVHGLPFDLSHKQYNWDDSFYYKNTGGFVSCSPHSALYQGAQPTGDPWDIRAVQPSINNGRQVFKQLAPNTDYRNVGSVVGIDQLVIETKGDASAPSP